MKLSRSHSSPSTLKAVILGAGSWGTALALHLARCGYDVTLLARDDGHADRMLQQGDNREYLPIPFPQNLKPSADFSHLRGAEMGFLACPSQGVSEFCRRIGEINFASSQRPFLVTLCKGFIPESLRLPLSLAAEILPEFELGVLSGPTYALDVALGKPTAAVLASAAAPSRLSQIQEWLNSADFRLYRSADVRGVELGGCLKNPYAIGMGLASSLGYGDNGRAALLTRMMKELARIGVALGGQRETFYGLSGLGDLLATAQGSWSRNRCFGERIGNGESPETIIQSQKAVVEGYRSTRGFYELCQKMHISCPILDEIYQILYGGKKMHDVLPNLMQRELKSEE